MKESLNVGYRVKVFDQVGEITKVEKSLSNDVSKITIAFDEGPPKTYLYPLTEIKKIPSPIELILSGNFDSPIKFNLNFNANRLSLAYEYDHLLSLSATRTNLEPYQIEAVWRVLNSYKQRYLLADDVGLGKTIEAGMIIKEIALRGRAKRILIIVPAPLKFQWQREMIRRFDESFMIYDSNYVKNLKRSLPKEVNVWEYDDKIITSIDYAKQEHVLIELERTKWDIILFDEAHKLSASKSGNTIRRTQRYRLAEALCDNTESLLLLTATPHKGDSYAFYAIISFIDPYIFFDEDSIDSLKLNKIMIRRGKDGIKDEKGKPVFKERDVITIPIKFTKEETILYNAVTDYVSRIYNLAKSLNNRAVGFAMIILQKRMVSSIAAIRSSLKNRLSNLIGEAVPTLTIEEKARLRDYIKDPDSLDDWEKERFERKLEVLNLPTTPKGLKLEIGYLKELIEISKRIKVDSKAEKLLNFIDGILSKDQEEKILIFTEYVDTLNYLIDLIKEKGYKYTVIHGSMPMEERELAEKIFESKETNIMVATDAAGEGINLQFCHIMVNYDLPWNPNRIDQRIGRLHRYGQKRDVKAYNFFISNTREGLILIRLMEKVKIIEEELGGKISEIIGLILEGIDLPNLIMNAIAENKPIEVSMKDIEKAIKERKTTFKKIEETFLMDLRKFDLENTLKLIDYSYEKSASEEDIEKFIRTFFSNIGGKIEPTRFKEVYRILPPKEILKTGIKNKYEKVTFSKEIAKEKGSEVEFIAFGHPLLEEIISFCKDKTYDFGGRVTLKSFDILEYPAILFNFVMKFSDGTGKTLIEKLLPIFVTMKNKHEIFGMDKVLQLKNIEVKNAHSDLVKDICKKCLDLYKIAEDQAIEEVINYSEKAKRKKNREVQIKRSDAKAYFIPRIEQIRKRIKNYRKRLYEGEDMKIAIRGEQARLKDLQEKYKSYFERLNIEQQIIEEMPVLLSAAVIIPS